LTLRRLPVIIEEAMSYLAPLLLAECPPRRYTAKPSRFVVSGAAASWRL